jgi:sec-independent protein translocase protein TatA
MQLAFLSPSPMELLFIAVLALIVLGPKRLPEVARSVGHGMREMRESFQGPGDDDEDEDEEDEDDRDWRALDDEEDLDDEAVGRDEDPAPDEDPPAEDPQAEAAASPDRG